MIARRMVIPALALVVAAGNVGAQQVLQGGVAQSDTVSDLLVQRVVLDMYHLLSIMWGNAPASAQQAFTNDVGQFHDYAAAGNVLASKLAPCINSYVQAYPHVINESRYYAQNNSAAFNREAAVANPLLQSGSRCVNATTTEQFAGTGGNPYRPAPSPPVQAPVYSYPYYATPASAPSYAPPPRTNPGGCVPPDTWSPAARAQWYQTYVLTGRIRCPGGYDPCANPDAPSWCPRPGQAAPSGVYPPLQTASEFSNEMRALAEQVLQAAGRIAKASTDAMDVTKHNNVGIGVGFGAFFGGIATNLGAVARQYRAIAASGSAAQQQAAVLQLATEAASESQAMAGQATQTVNELQRAAPGTYGAESGSIGYTKAAVLYGTKPMQPPQDVLPTCTVLSCHRLAQLLQRDVELFQVFNKIRPAVITRITSNGKHIIQGGLNAQEVANALKSIGINAEVGTGLTGLMNEVRAGRPVIAGMETEYAQGLQTPLHAIVVEGLEYRAGELGLQIYDPVGWFYWQPLSAFSEFFTGEFVKPI